MNKITYSLLTLCICFLVGCSNNKTITAQIPISTQTVDQTSINKSDVLDYDSISLNAANLVMQSMLSCQDEILNVGNISDDRLKNAKELVITKINIAQNRFKDIKNVPNQRKELNDILTKIVDQTQNLRDDISQYKNTKEDKLKINEKLKTINLQIETFNLKSQELRKNN